MINPTRDMQLGKFYIDCEMVESSAIAEMLVLMGFTPLRVECLGYKDRYEYIGTSHLFRTVPLGIMIPTYSIIMSADYDKDGEVLGTASVSVTEDLDN